MGDHAIPVVCLAPLLCRGHGFLLRFFGKPLRRQHPRCRHPAHPHHPAQSQIPTPLRHHNHFSAHHHRIGTPHPPHGDHRQKFTKSTSKKHLPKLTGVSSIILRFPHHYSLSKGIRCVLTILLCRGRPERRIPPVPLL